jgi:hypothetical protein
VKDLAGLLRGAGDALADEIEEAGDVLEAGEGWQERWLVWRRSA